ncbi:hypothetical protein [Polymorphum gilvum]|nr:hypothetical protein [Polymorphum gilvum]
MYLTEDGRAARARYWGGVAQETKKSLGGNMLDHGITTAQMTARMVGLTWRDLDEAERHQCKEVVHRAGIDLAEALKARYEGDFEFEPKSKLLHQALLEVAPAVAPVQQQQPEAQTEPLFSKVYPSYIEGQIRRGEWRQQTGNQAHESGGAKFGHGSGGIVLPRAA